MSRRSPRAASAVRQAQPAPIVPQTPSRRDLVASAAVALSHASSVSDHSMPQPFVLPEFPPGVVPDGVPKIAQDEGIAATAQWAGNVYAGLNLVDGVMWPGF